ncbi:hypothetical protein [Liquorilactobacillus hordei]|uniref:hypothetical protein n=1 Tax=Liquorilactobacillus hordei TaxID=468911 RepID=UPI001CBC32CF|nr:hypothetical protein [Liquorilactobacillus hordei]
MMCGLFSKVTGEDIVPVQVGYESIKFYRDEIGYPVMTAELPEWVLVHLFIYDDWSGYAVMNMEQTKMFSMGIFYGEDR